MCLKLRTSLLMQVEASILSGEKSGGCILRFDSHRNVLVDEDLQSFPWMGEHKGVATDAEGNAYITGDCRRLANAQADLFIAKYSPEGTLLFSDTY